jgi:hypothetical protein
MTFWNPTFFHMLPVVKKDASALEVELVCRVCLVDGRCGNGIAGIQLKHMQASEELQHVLSKGVAVIWVSNIK